MVSSPYPLLSECSCATVPAGPIHRRDAPLPRLHATSRPRRGARSAPCNDRPARCRALTPTMIGRSSDELQHGGRGAGPLPDHAGKAEQRSPLPLLSRRTRVRMHGRVVAEQSRREPPLAAFLATRALRCAPRPAQCDAPVYTLAGTPEMILDARAAIKPVEVATGLNPADFNANWQNFKQRRQRPLCGLLQVFSGTTRGVRYRFTREKSLVRTQPCP